MYCTENMGTAGPSATPGGLVNTTELSGAIRLRNRWNVSVESGPATRLAGRLDQQKSILRVVQYH